MICNSLHVYIYIYIYHIFLSVHRKDLHLYLYHEIAAEEELSTKRLFGASIACMLSWV